MEKIKRQSKQRTYFALNKIIHVTVIAKDISTTGNVWRHKCFVSRQDTLQGDYGRGRLIDRYIYLSITLK